MERKISVERLYTIADYQNIKFTSEIDHIPDAHALDNKVVQLLYYGQFIDCDIAYKKYMELREKLAREKVKTVMEVLEEEREKTQAELIELTKTTTQE